MTNQQPLISIITPTHNRADYLKETIQSVLMQTYTHYELLIIDNGSTDNTKEIVSSFQDKRISYFYQENSGSPVSPRNHGFQKAKGEIIAILDSDDLWLPDKLSLQVREFQKNQSIGLVYSDAFLINPQGKIHGSYSHFHKPYQGKILVPLLRSNFIPAATVTFLKKVLVQFGPLNEDYIISHDLELYLKIAYLYSISYIPKPLAKVRIHPVGLTRNRIKIRQESMSVVKAWCYGEIQNELPVNIKEHIWAYHCFVTGFDMLALPENRQEGKYWLKQALRLHRKNPIYWLGLFLSKLPTSLVSKILSWIKKQKSIEYQFQK